MGKRNGDKQKHNYRKIEQRVDGRKSIDRKRWYKFGEGWYE